MEIVLDKPTPVSPPKTYTLVPDVNVSKDLKIIDAGIEATTRVFLAMGAELVKVDNVLAESVSLTTPGNARLTINPNSDYDDNEDKWTFDPECTVQSGYGGVSYDIDTMLDDAYNGIDY